MVLTNAVFACATPVLSVDTANVTPMKFLNYQKRLVAYHLIAPQAWNVLEKERAFADGANVNLEDRTRYFSYFVQHNNR